MKKIRKKKHFLCCLCDSSYLCFAFGGQILTPAREFILGFRLAYLYRYDDIITAEGSETFFFACVLEVHSFPIAKQLLCLRDFSHVY